MNWITNGAGSVLDLAADTAFFTAASVIEREMTAQQALFKASDVFALLSQFAAGTLDANDGALLDRILPLLNMTQDRLKELWNSFVATPAGAALARYRPLLRTLASLTATSTPDADRVLDWKLLDAEKKPAGGAVDAVSYAVAVEATAGLSFEVAPELENLPAGLQLAPVTLRASLSGAFAATAEAGIPINIGKLTLSSAASAASSLSYYAHSKDGVLWAAAIARTLGHLVNPFDPAALAASDEIQLIHLKATGQLSVGARFGLERGFNVAKGLTAVASVTYGVTGSVAGEFEYHLYRPFGTTGVVRVAVTRHKQVGATRELKAAVTVDATSLAKHVKSQVDQHLAEYQDFLQQFKDWTTPGTFIANEIKSEIRKLAKNDSVKTLLGQKFAIQIDNAAIARFVERVTGQADLAAVWSGSPESASVELAKKVLSGLPTPLASEPQLVEALATALSGPLTTLRTKLSDFIGNIAGQATELDGLKKQLSKLGENVTDTGATLDAKVQALLAPVTRVLGKYQSAVQRFAAVVEKASAAKLNFELSRAVTSEHGDNVMLVADFHDLTRGREALMRLLTGSAEEVLQLAQQIDSSGRAPVTLVEGSFARFHHRREATSFKFVLLDIELGSQSIIDARTDITTNIRGEINIVSTLKRDSNGFIPGESRDLSFVNVFRLAAAKDLTEKSIEISLELSRRDEELKTRELRGFLEGLEKTHLITAGATERALAAYRAKAVTAGDGIKAELSVALRLEGHETLRLIGIDAADNAQPMGKGTPRRQAIHRVAIEEIFEAYGAYDPDYIRIFENDTNRTLTRLRLGDTLIEQVLAFPPESNERDRLLGKLHNEDRAVRPRLEELMQWRRRLDEIADALATMQQVYLAGSGWNEAEFNKRQIAIGRNLRSWLQVEGVLGMLLSNEIRIYTLAFIGAVQRLAEVARGAGEPLLVVSMQLDGSEVFRVS